MARLILVNRYFHPDECATSRFLTDLARHLAQRHEVVVLASRQRLEDPAARLPSRSEIDGVVVQRLWSSSWGRHRLAGRMLDYLSFLAAVGAWLMLWVRRGDTVLAKTDPPLLGVVTTLATLGRSVTRIQWLQDLYPETAARLGVLAGGPVTGVVRALRNWSLRHSDRIVTVSAGMLAYLRDSVGAAKLIHIPNWSDDFAPPGGATRGGATLTVGYSGNLGRAHPIEGLLQLAERATNPALQFLFTGGGTHHERLRERVQQLGRPNWAFLPYQPRERLGELLRRADVHLVVLDPRLERFVFPSKVYGILSAGRPVLHLGDPSGEVARLIREQGCGWSLAPDSGEAILSLLEQLRADPTQLETAGRNARLAHERHGLRSRALANWDEVLATAGRQTV